LKRYVFPLRWIGSEEGEREPSDKIVMTCPCVCDLAGAASPRVENVKMAKNAHKKASL
jgi:hypothetical protein